MIKSELKNSPRSLLFSSSRRLRLLGALLGTGTGIGPVVCCVLRARPASQAITYCHKLFHQKGYRINLLPSFYPSPPLLNLRQATMSTDTTAVAASSPIALCQDGHRCENGAKCVENPNEEGSFYCDCQEAGPDHAYEGLYCEHKATQYCKFDTKARVPSTTTFCTNNGKCKQFVNTDERHFGCDCPTNYEGSHCQFVRGTQPEDWPSTQYTAAEERGEGSSSVALGGAAIAIIVVVSIAVLGAVIVVVKKGLAKSRKQSTMEVHSAADELALESDGSTLRQEGVLPGHDDKNLHDISIDDDAEVI